MTVLARIREDITAARVHDPAARGSVEIFLTYSGLHAIWAYRLTTASGRGGTDAGTHPVAVRVERGQDRLTRRDETERGRQCGVIGHGVGGDGVEDAEYERRHAVDPSAVRRWGSG